MRLVGRAGTVAVGLLLAAMAVAGCGGDGGADANPAARDSGDHAEAAAREHQAPDGAQRSGPPSAPASSTPPKSTPTSPSAPRMPAVSHAVTGGIQGITQVSIDSAGRWKRSGKNGGKLTASQVTTLNRLLTSSGLAQEAKRYAAANGRQLPTDCGQPLAQTLRTSKLTLRKSSCDKNFVATPVHDEVVKLLYQYTDG